MMIDRTGDSRKPSAEDYVSKLNKRFRTTILMAQPPDQQAAPRQTNGHPGEGSEIEGIKPLTQGVMCIVVAHHRRGTLSRSTTLPAMYMGQPRNALSALSANGLNAHSQEDHHG